MTQYDLIVLLADAQGYSIDSDGYVDNTSPLCQEPADAAA